MPWSRPDAELRRAIFLYALAALAVVAALGWGLSWLVPLWISAALGGVAGIVIIGLGTLAWLATG